MAIARLINVIHELATLYYNIDDAFEKYKHIDHAQRPKLRASRVPKWDWKSQS